MNSKLSISNRLTYAFLILAVLVIGLSIFFYVILSGRMVMDGMRRSLNGYSRSLAAVIEKDPSRETIVALAAEHRVGIIYQKDDVVIAVNGWGESEPAEDLLWDNARREFVRMPLDNGSVVFVWNMLVFITTHKPLILGLLILLAGILFACHLYLKSQLQPLLWLRKGVEQVASGNFKVRAPVIRKDEIGQVADAFNQMAERIETMMADRERLLADVSHELRSPIARMNVALELIPDHPRKTTIKKDILEMETLISHLLERERMGVRLDHGDLVQLEPCDLVSNVISLLGDRSPGVRFQPVRGCGPLLGDPVLLEVLVRNLLDNALKFSTPDSGSVEVTVAREDGMVVLQIQDDGPGVPSEELERIFEPFVKLNPARGHRSGYGLGLNLCLRIVESHGGRLTLTSNGERGACVRVMLPGVSEPS